jgi:phosphatidylserine/phosphatidylglycerophosphate/cardiolipin synthase-like enzyme
MRARALVPALLLACNPPPDAADLAGTRGGRVDVFFNEPGSREANTWDPDAIDVMVELIDGANATLDFAVMGFSKTEVIDAIERAFDRGVVVRMVGDAGHLGGSGYNRMMDRHIPMSVGNLNHIMHHKFLVVDGRFVFCGTANWTETDLVRNSNNFAVIDSPAISADFTAEFEQMFNGAFGNNKVEISNGRKYQLGDTEMEVWFSPNEDAMGRIRDVLAQAQESVRFTIFAFTKNEVGSDLLRLQEQFLAADLADGVAADEAAWAGMDFRERRSVAGVIDQSQLHSNGQYHEVYRLLAGGVPMHLDGNDNSAQPGDYQAGGGRLHSKTMIIDVYGENPTVITGSFNWSAAATQSNDEYLLVMRGARVARMYDAYFEGLWSGGRTMGIDRVANGVSAGDVVINEVMWYGVNSSDANGFDEFIELRNTTDRDIRLDMWQISNSDDVVVGLPPGSLLPAGGTFLILDHVLEPYVDGEPQDERSAYLSGDLVVNSFNDNRQHRLYLKDGAFELILRDPDGVAIDRAGDGGPAFAGGPNEDGSQVRSMERAADPGDGADPSRWAAFSGDQGTGVVNPDYADEILASPGAPNSSAR